jgi:MFS family permease
MSRSRVTTSADRGNGMQTIFRTLRYRNYRLFFTGQLISLIGTWMQQVALTWLIYRLTNSAFLLGIAGFAGQIPMFLFSSIAGVIADRFNKHRILIITQLLAMLQAIVLAVLTLTGAITIWYILPLLVFLGIVNAFDMPTRQSFVLEMIENKEDLGNAIALNSSMFNGARLIGPAIAGILIGTIGEGPCFIINAVSFLAVIIALLAMKLPAKPAQQRKEGILDGYKEGFRYVTRFKPIAYILLLIAIVSFIGIPFATLMPVFARDILNGGPHTLGFLMGAHGIGALLGAAILASRKSVRGLSRWIAAAAFTFGAGLCFFAFSTNQALSFALLVVVGFGMMVQLASSNTIIQTVADDDKRGRVMSFYTVAFTGMTPFGSLLTGALASRIGAPVTIFISGLLCIAAAALFTTQLPAIRKEIRPIYRKIGIIPDQPADEISATPIPLGEER